MIRAFLEEGLLFLAPFACFALVLLAMRRNLLHPQSWSGPGPWLGMAGLLLVLASFVYAGLFGERHTGSFEPTHVENGRVVPGRFH